MTEEKIVIEMDVPESLEEYSEELAKSVIEKDLEGMDIPLYWEEQTVRVK